MQIYQGVCNAFAYQAPWSHIACKAAGCCNLVIVLQRVCSPGQLATHLKDSTKPSLQIALSTDASGDCAAPAPLSRAMAASTSPPSPTTTYKRKTCTPALAPQPTRPRPTSHVPAAACLPLRLQKQTMTQVLRTALTRWSLLSCPMAPGTARCFQPAVAACVCGGG